MARNSKVEEDDGVSLLVNEEVGALVAEAARGFDWRRDDLIGNVVDLVFAMLAVLLLQHLLPNCFGVVARF